MSFGSAACDAARTMTEASREARQVSVLSYPIHTVQGKIFGPYHHGGDRAVRAHLEDDEPVHGGAERDAARTSLRPDQVLALRCLRYSIAYKY